MMEESGGYICLSQGFVKLSGFCPRVEGFTQLAGMKNINRREGEKIKGEYCLWFIPENVIQQGGE